MVVVSFEFYSLGFLLKGISSRRENRVHLRIVREDEKGILHG